MLKTVNRISLATSLISLCLGTSMVIAQPINSNLVNNQTQYLAQRHGGWGGGNGSFGGGFIDKLNLTTEQREQMQQIRQKYQSEITQLKDNLRTERTKLREMMASNDSNTNISNQHQKIVNLNQQLSKLRFDSMLEMRQVLTTEQRETFANLMKERQGRRGNW
jgi:Spy/CpxP family protein refolding chaperone